MKFVPVNQPLLEGNEKKYLNECIDSGWISSEGHFVSLFEKQFAERHGRKHGIAVSSGTAALQVAVDLLDLKNGDEVIVPTFTIISCVNAILQANATPVLIDCEPDTFNITIEGVEKAISSNTKAIILVHIYGLPIDADPILEIAHKKGIIVIEDCAEVIGLNYKSRPCGSLGQMSIFSFYSNKHVTTGEGGMILTDDDIIAKRSRSSRNLCFQEDKRFYHKRTGWNFRMTNLQAAVGVAQLERLDSFIAIKRKMGELYSKILHSCPMLQIPVESTSYANNIYWAYGIVLTDECKYNADQLIQLLKEQNIGSRPFFYPMHQQPVFNEMNLFLNDSHPNAERIADRGFYLPCGMALKEPEIEYVAKCLLDIVN